MALIMTLLGACGGGLSDVEERFIDTDPLEDRIQRGVPESAWCYDSELLGQYENGLTVNQDCTIAQDGKTYKLTVAEAFDPVYAYNREVFGSWIETLEDDRCIIQLYNNTLRISCYGGNYEPTGFQYTGERTEDWTLPPGSDPYPIEHLYE